MYQCFNKIKVNCDILTFMIISTLLVMASGNILNQGYSVSAAGNIGNESESEKLRFDYSTVPTNISVLPESLPTGNLYLSSILSNGTITYTRNLTDELFPFQLDRWYQQIKFIPNYEDQIEDSNTVIGKLIIGQMSDFDNFDELLDHSRMYVDVALNSTMIIDLPNQDVSFMEAEMKFPTGDVGIYYGLFDGNQQTDKSELSSYLNPESIPSSLSSIPAIGIKSDSLLYNATFTLVCNDLYKLGYDKCVN
jgi:hypothetical protein